MSHLFEFPIEIDGVENLQTSLLKWFSSKGRHWIPWKLTKEGKSPRSGEYLPVYQIWIAEVMLQQTQLQVVLPYWTKWIEVFPTLEDLAKSDEQKILYYWQGLGYYSRAKRLYLSAEILFQFQNRVDSSTLFSWPISIEDWIKLPGIGRSTAGSIISSAFDLPTAILDGNVKRILSRLIAANVLVQKNENKFWELSNFLLDRKFPRNFNQALMDLGTLICTPKNPKCTSCPWQNYCSAYLFYDPNDFPVKELKKQVPKHLIGLGIVINSSGYVLIAQRLNNSSMGGMWEFPGGKHEDGESIKETIAREINEELSIKVRASEKLIDLDHAYSHKKLHFVVYLCDFISGTAQALASQEVRWVKPSDLMNYPFPAANHKIIIALKKYLSRSNRDD